MVEAVTRTPDDSDLSFAHLFSIIPHFDIRSISDLENEKG